MMACDENTAIHSGFGSTKREEVVNEQGERWSLLMASCHGVKERYPTSGAFWRARLRASARRRSS